MDEIKPVFSDDRHANVEEALHSLARLLGRQTAKELVEAEQADPVTPLNKYEGARDD
ncbi:MAG: hypothetical protein O3B69_10755 [Proteobacteria bacterium]|nr:hypothetical protein [Pseudomonadota bacterium]